ncbi:MAG: sensor histidine kinase [Oscillospiraceae bacterium]|jgi:two-component system phosphate regulon sensor histidine kinase PhoR
MKYKIFKSIFLVFIVVFLLCFSIVLGTLHLQSSAQDLENLRIEAAYIAQAVETSGIGFIDQVNTEPALRITRIQPDGTVQYDSMTDPAMLGNHGDREEIREALKDGVGSSARYSETLSQKTLNYAIRLSDGTILRVSETQSTLFSLVLRIFTPIVLILVLATIFSGLLAARVSRAVTKPINAINLEHPDERDVYEEVQPLVRRINAQSRQIQSQMDELRAQHEAQDQIRREFTANVSHELKTPLTAISGYAEIMRDGLVRPEDMTMFAQRIYDEAQRMITLVGDILRLSKLEERQIPDKKTEVDLYDLSKEVLDHLQPVAKQADVTLHLSGSHAMVYGVPQILEEMVSNVCDNAIKYNRTGGSVKLSIVETDREVEFTVEDTGIGISAEEIDRIFERFYRVDKSHSREIGGTGLGLSIVKHGARYHNARIEVESELNTGTTISLFFPSCRAEENSIELENTSKSDNN